MNDERRYAVLIGSSEFDRESGLGNLRCPQNDVEDMAELITAAETGLFLKENVFKLINRPHYEVARHINVLTSRSNTDDVIFIYFSGHGKQDSSGRLYLATVNTSVRALETTSIPLELLRMVLDGCPSRKIIIVLDCCFSGAAGASFLRGDADDQMRLFARAQGTFLLTASTGVQTAREKEGDRNAVFTKHVIAGIRSGRADANGDGIITMDELFGYVHQHVPFEVPQEPERYFFNARGDIAFAKAGPAGEGRVAPTPRVSFQRLGPLRSEIAWTAKPTGVACVCMTVSPMGRFCAAGFEDGTACVLRTGTGECFLLRQGGDHRPVWSIAFSPGGDHLALVSGNSEIAVHDLGSGNVDSLTIPDRRRLIEWTSSHPHRSQLERAKGRSTSLTCAPSGSWSTLCLAAPSRAWPVIGPSASSPLERAPAVYRCLTSTRRRSSLTWRSTGRAPRRLPSMRLAHRWFVAASTASFVCSISPPVRASARSAHSPAQFPLSHLVPMATCSTLPTGAAPLA
jgi:hypothetical protein